MRRALLTRRRVVEVLCVGLAATAIIAGLFGRGDVRTAHASAGDFDDGVVALDPRLTPGEAARIALGRMGEHGVVAQVTLLARVSDVELVEPAFGRLVPGTPDPGPVWLVRGTGRFVGQFGSPDRGPIVGDSGYFVIEDATGDVLGMGIP